MDLDAQRGARVQSERKRLALSQQAAADAAGIRREMWAKYEAGAEPGAKALAGMVLMGVDVIYILTGQLDQSAASPLAQDEAVLLDSYRRCTPAARGNLIQTAALLAAGVSTAPKSERQTASVKVSSKHGHAAGRDVNVNSEETNGKGHKPQGARSRA